MSGQLEEFRLVRPLGHGGMGVVYLGYDTVLRRAVAIKLIGPRNSSAANRERFLIEARAIAQLSHPNIVTIYRVGTTRDGRPFLVQELIRGKSLDRVPQPMPWREVCQLAIGIARGLEAVHRRGILHCDVKPANVMLDDNGVPRLIDFGLARLSAASESREAFADESATAQRTCFEPLRASSRNDVAETRDLPAGGASEPMPDEPPPPGRDVRDAAPISDVCDEPQRAPASTSAGNMRGTPRYMAPERWRGGPADVRSDLYALGVVLYELLVGIVPHPQADRDELRRAILSGRVRPIHERAPDTHPALARLVMRCLALDLHERPGSASSIAHELAGLLIDAPEVLDGDPRISGSRLRSA
jgi:eukaryotic-like serine/threonine-protein kinase